MAKHYVEEWNTSIHIVCRAMLISERCYRYQPKLLDENEVIADWLIRLRMAHRRWGFGLCF